MVIRAFYNSLRKRPAPSQQLTEPTSSESQQEQPQLHPQSRATEQDCLLQSSPQRPSTPASGHHPSLHNSTHSATSSSRPISFLGESDRRQPYDVSSQRHSQDSLTVPRFSLMVSPSSSASQLPPGSLSPSQSVSSFASFRRPALPRQSVSSVSSWPPAVTVSQVGPDLCASPTSESSVQFVGLRLLAMSRHSSPIDPEQREDVASGYQPWIPTVYGEAHSAALLHTEASERATQNSLLEPETGFIDEGSDRWSQESAVMEEDVLAPKISSTLHEELKLSKSVTWSNWIKNKKQPLCRTANEASSLVPEQEDQQNVHHDTKKGKEKEKSRIQAEATRTGKIYGTFSRKHVHSSEAAPWTIFTDDPGRKRISSFFHNPKFLSLSRASQVPLPTTTSLGPPVIDSSTDIHDTVSPEAPPQVLSHAQNQPDDACSQAKKDEVSGFCTRVRKWLSSSSTTPRERKKAVAICLKKPKPVVMSATRLDLEEWEAMRNGGATRSRMPPRPVWPKIDDVEEPVSQDPPAEETQEPMSQESQPDYMSQDPPTRSSQEPMSQDSQSRSQEHMSQDSPAQSSQEPMSQDSQPRSQEPTPQDPPAWSSQEPMPQDSQPRSQEPMSQDPPAPNSQEQMSQEPMFQDPPARGSQRSMFRDSQSRSQESMSQDTPTRSSQGSVSRDSQPRSREHMLQDFDFQSSRQPMSQDQWF